MIYVVAALLIPQSRTKPQADIFTSWKYSLDFEVKQKYSYETT